MTAELFYFCTSCAALFDVWPAEARCLRCGAGRLTLITRELVEDTGWTPEQLVAATARAGEESA
jgi:DNA-directed RNA polymerase subunit RPC12/RpoP